MPPTLRTRTRRKKRAKNFANRTITGPPSGPRGPIGKRRSRMVGPPLGNGGGWPYRATGDLWKQRV